MKAPVPNLYRVSCLLWIFAVIFDLSLGATVKSSNPKVTNTLQNGGKSIAHKRAVSLGKTVRKLGLTSSDLKPCISKAFCEVNSVSAGPTFKVDEDFFRVLVYLSKHDIDEEFEKVFGEQSNGSQDASIASEDSVDESYESYEPNRYGHYNRYGKSMGVANSSIQATISETTGRSLRLRGINKVAYARRKYNELSKVEKLTTLIKISSDIGQTLRSPRQCRKIFSDCKMSLELTIQVLNRTNSLLDKPAKKPTKPMKFSNAKLQFKQQMAELSEPVKMVTPSSNPIVTILTSTSMPITTQRIPEAQTVTSKLTTVVSQDKVETAKNTNDRLKKSNNEFDNVDDLDDYSLDEIVETEPMKIYSLFTESKTPVQKVDKGSTPFQKVDNSFPKDGAAENLDAYLLGSPPKAEKKSEEEEESKSKSSSESEEEEDEEEYDDDINGDYSSAPAYAPTAAAYPPTAAAYSPTAAAYPSAPAAYPPTAAAYPAYDDIADEYMTPYPAMRYRYGKPPRPAPSYRTQVADSYEEESAEDVATGPEPSSISEEDDTEYETVQKNHYPGPPYGQGPPPRHHVLDDGRPPYRRRPVGYGNDYPASDHPSSDEVPHHSAPTPVQTYPPSSSTQYSGSEEGAPPGGIFSTIFSSFSLPWFSSWTNPAVGIPHRPTKTVKPGQYPPQKYSEGVQEDVASPESSSSSEEEEEEEDGPRRPDPNLENGDYSQKRKRPQNTRPSLVVQETGLYPPVVVVDPETKGEQAYYESNKIQHEQQNYDPTNKRKHLNKNVQTSAQQGQTTYGSGDGYADYFDGSPMREMRDDDDDERDMNSAFGTVANQFSTSADKVPEFSEEEVKPNQIKGLYNAVGGGGKYTIRKKNKQSVPKAPESQAADSTSAEVSESASSSSEEGNY